MIDDFKYTCYIGFDDLNRFMDFVINNGFKNRIDYTFICCNKEQKNFEFMFKNNSDAIIVSLKFS